MTETRRPEIHPAFAHVPEYTPATAAFSHISPSSAPSTSSSSAYTSIRQRFRQKRHHEILQHAPRVLDIQVGTAGGIAGLLQKGCVAGDFGDGDGDLEALAGEDGVGEGDVLCA